MKLERLCNENKHLFDRAFALYESAFPRDERRDMSEQERAMKNENYHFDLIMNDQELLGVMLYWETNDFIFLEHFTTMPEVRGKGYGAAALEILKLKGKLVLLEIEPPVDEMTCRRYEFYKRNSFTMNPFYHIQAKYHLGDEDLELKILSYPREMTENEYRSFYEYYIGVIGIQANITNEFVVRKARENDDILQIARLIYLTDPYIYPYWFDSMEQGQKVIAEMIKLPTLYALENILVAVASNGDVAGAMVSKMTPFEERYELLLKAFENAGVECDKRTEKIFNDYYAKMGEAQDGYYFANIATAPEYRKKGICAALMQEAMKGQDFCTLECVIANAGALRVYQRMGFKIAHQYPGVFDIPCYKMIYRR